MCSGTGLASKPAIAWGEPVSTFPVSHGSPPCPDDGFLGRAPEGVGLTPFLEIGEAVPHDRPRAEATANELRTAASPSPFSKCLDLEAQVPGGLD
jgi:hypothetical protein